jgi:hypothetical protein
METLTENEDSDSIDEEITHPENLNGSFNRHLLLYLILAVLGASFQTGWCLGVFNTPVEVIKDFYREVFIERGHNLTKTELNTLWSITNGLLPLGGVFG